MGFYANPNQEDPNFINYTPLHFAAMYCTVSSNYLAIARLLLLSSDADPNKMSAVGYAPLYVAALHDNLEMVILLLKYGATPIAL